MYFNGLWLLGQDIKKNRMAFAILSGKNRNLLSFSALRKTPRRRFVKFHFTRR